MEILLLLPLLLLGGLLASGIDLLEMASKMGAKALILVDIAHTNDRTRREKRDSLCSQSSLLNWPHTTVFSHTVLYFTLLLVYFSTLPLPIPF